jgi:hypothetical protein
MTVKMSDPPIVCVATGLERWAARLSLPREVRVERVGIGVQSWTSRGTGPCISCGLAGGLLEAVEPGTVVIPAWVGLPSGERLRCSPPLVSRLIAAARRLGFEPLTGPLITVPRLVTGPIRRHWAEQGYFAVDMESGLLLRRSRVGVVVRVVLDTPRHELSPTWADPARALTHPVRWAEALRLGLTAPIYARRAADVVRAALLSDIG